MDPLTRLPDGMDGRMHPVGYMSKRPHSGGYLSASHVEDVYSVSNCISGRFVKDCISYGKHNECWMFDSPELIREISKEAGVSLEGTRMFYYEAYSLEYLEEEEIWREYNIRWERLKGIAPPMDPVLEGFDAATFSRGSDAECSSLSCNYLAEEMPESVNAHCLLRSFEETHRRLEAGELTAEPGPYRIIAVYTVVPPWEPAETGNGEKR